MAVEAGSANGSGESRRHPSVEIAVITWNRRETARAAIASALAVGRPNVSVVVYDNGSEDGTDDMIRDQFGAQVSVERWDENRGRHANMTRAFEQAKSDYLVLLFDDEELCPDGLEAALDTAQRYPEAAFTFGRARLRDQRGAVMNDSMLMAPPAFVPPPYQEGKDWIRSIFSGGDYTWICSVLFDLRRVQPAEVVDRDSPCDDSGLLMRSALRGGVAYVPVPIATKTDGNGGESVREGLVVEVEGVPGHGMTIAGIIGYRRSLERFLLTDGRGAFAIGERRRMLADIDLVIAHLVGERLTEIRREQGWRAAWHDLREAGLWVRRARTRVRLARAIARSFR